MYNDWMIFPAHKLDDVTKELLRSQKEDANLKRQKASLEKYLPEAIGTPVHKRLEERIRSIWWDIQFFQDSRNSLLAKLTIILQETKDFGIEYPDDETDATRMSHETIMKRLPLFRRCAFRASWANRHGHGLVLRGRPNPNREEDAITWRRYQEGERKLLIREDFRRG